MRAAMRELSRVPHPAVWSLLYVPFGAMSGSVVLTRPVPPGSALRPDNLPEWTLSYPMSANRVQFIAHYEVIYRVGVCPDRIVSQG